MVDRTSWTQVPLFPENKPLRVRLEILLDPEACTGIVVLEAVEFPSRTLRALSSSAPVAFADLDGVVRMMGSELTELLHSNTCPF